MDSYKRSGLFKHENSTLMSNKPLIAKPILSIAQRSLKKNNNKSIADNEVFLKNNQYKPLNQSHIYSRNLTTRMELNPPIHLVANVDASKFTNINPYVDTKLIKKTGLVQIPGQDGIVLNQPDTPFKYDYGTGPYDISRPKDKKQQQQQPQLATTVTSHDNDVDMINNNDNDVVELCGSSEVCNNGFACVYNEDKKIVAEKLNNYKALPLVAVGVGALASAITGAVAFNLGKNTSSSDNGGVKQTKKINIQIKHTTNVSNLNKTINSIFFEELKKKTLIIDKKTIQSIVTRYNVHAKGDIIFNFDFEQSGNIHNFGSIKETDVSTTYTQVMSDVYNELIKQSAGNVAVDNKESAAMNKQDDTLSSILGGKSAEIKQNSSFKYDNESIFSSDFQKILTNSVAQKRTTEQFNQIFSKYKQSIEQELELVSKNGAVTVAVIAKQNLKAIEEFVVDLNVANTIFTDMKESNFFKVDDKLTSELDIKNKTAGSLTHEVTGFFHVLKTYAVYLGGGMAVILGLAAVYFFSNSSWSKKMLNNTFSRSRSRLNNNADDDEELKDDDNGKELNDYFSSNGENRAISSGDKYKDNSTINVDKGRASGDLTCFGNQDCVTMASGAFVNDMKSTQNNNDFSFF